jgi:hypothetical protein
MTRKKRQQRPTKSQRSLSTKRLSAFTRISKPLSGDAEVAGVSMWPLLRDGYRVRFQKTDPETLEPGDIIVLRGEDRRGRELLQVHRLLDRVGPFFLEAGDNGFYASLVSGSAILGKVVSAEDRNGKPIALLPVVPDRESARFRFFCALARTFVYAHEMKDRAFGDIKSPLLWKASVAYRKGLSLVGVKVPVIYPR